MDKLVNIVRKVQQDWSSTLHASTRSHYNIIGNKGEVMKKINKIRLGGRVIPIVWSAKKIADVDRELEFDEGITRGAYRPGEQEIVLNPEYHCVNSQEEFKIVLHEVMHAVDDYMGRDWDEGFVRCFANVFGDMLVASGFINPKELIIAGVPLNTRI